MKTLKLFLSLVLIVGLSGTVFAGKPVRRTWDKDANGNFDWSCNETPDYVEITCYASQLCKICPESVASTHCNQHSAYDPTDFLAMEDLFKQADNMIEGGQDAGSIDKSYWVEGEQYPRNYHVTWQLTGNQYVMEWQRVEE